MKTKISCQRYTSSFIFLSVHRPRGIWSQNCRYVATKISVEYLFTKQCVCITTFSINTYVSTTHSDASSSITTRSPSGKQDQNFVYLVQCECYQCCCIRKFSIIISVLFPCGKQSFPWARPEIQKTTN